jgi:hypothetical protein
LRGRRRRDRLLERKDLDLALGVRIAYVHSGFFFGISSCKVEEKPRTDAPEK